MKLLAYPRTKPSGVEWLGDVPEHWIPIALRRTSTRYAGGTPDRSNDSYWDAGTIPWINSGSVNQGLITEPSTFISEEAYRNSSARWVAKGALVMALAGQGKTKGMVAQTGIATTCNQSMAAICPTSPTEARYLYWQLVSQYEHIRNMAGGEARDGLNLEILGSIPCLKVPPAEQRAIAAFLDRETGRMDRLVAKKRELIERLKEKRTALISRTVTRGLPPAAARAVGLPVKPSALNWLGDIPKHWKVMRFRRLIIRLDQGWSPNANNYPAAPEELGVLKLGAASKGRFYPEDNKAMDEIPEGVIPITPASGDLLISRANTPDLVGDVCVVKGNHPNRIIPDLLYRLRLRADTNGEFICWFLLSRSGRAQIESDARGSSGSMVKLGQGHVRAWTIPFPPPAEQAAIAAYLDEETAKLDALAGKVEEAMERLQEYRTALITAAVTGKIDVRKISQ